MISKYRELGLGYRTAFILIFLSVLTTVFEVFGIGMFLPIFQFMQSNGDIQVLASNHVFWNYLFIFFNGIGVDITLGMMLTLAFLLFIVRQIFSYVRIIYQSIVNKTLTKKMRDKIFNLYLSANSSYHDRVPVGELVNIITTEVALAVFSILGPIELVAYGVLFLGYISILLFLSWEMTVSSILILIITSQIPRFWINKSKSAGRKLASANNSLSSFLVDRFRSPRLVRLSNTESAENHEFQLLTKLQKDCAISNSLLQAKTDVSMEPFLIGFSMIFIYFSYSVFNMDIEIIGAYVVISLRLLPISKSSVTLFQKIQGALGSVEAIQDRVEQAIKYKERDNGVLELPNAFNIQFRNVFYKYYNTDRFSLENISLDIPCGSMIGIVGPSGSGKSTIVDLLPRIRAISSGSILISGCDIQEYSLSNLRGSISYAPQNPQIFSGTIMDHIKYGKINATDKEVFEAAKLSGSYDFISGFPDGFDTNLGENAIRLSGGQRQRLDLARAIIKNAQILILDEPTSGLDIESESIFKNSLRLIRSKTNMTIIIISHQLSSINEADNIIVLNDGKIDSQGSHEDLMMDNGWYAKAWKTQSESLSL